MKLDTVDEKHEEAEIEFNRGRLQISLSSGDAMSDDSCVVTLSALGTLQLYFFLHKQLLDRFGREE